MVLVRWRVWRGVIATIALGRMGVLYLLVEGLEDDHRGVM